MYRKVEMYNRNVIAVIGVLAICVVPFLFSDSDEIVSPEVVLQIESLEVERRIESPSVDLQLESLEVERQILSVSAGSGLGVISPEIYSNRVLYFYNSSDEAAGISSQYQPVDSLFFAEGEVGVEASGIGSQPDFNPLNTKLDYGILNIRVVGRTQWAMEVVVDEKTSSTLWVTLGDVEFRPWATFFFWINSVERIDMDTNPLRTAPGESSSTIPNPSDRECLQVNYVNSEWMRVSSSEVCGDIEVEDAWIRWWKDGRLLVSYNLLS